LTSEPDKLAARAARDKALEARECFSLGFLEMCGDESFLKQVIRIAQTGLIVDGRLVPAIKWGQKCCCTLPMHREDCWKVVYKVYQFNSDHFFHLYVHQMLAEGVFNMHDHNKMNVTADFKRAAVNMKVFDSHHNGLLSISFIPNNDITNVFVNTHNTTSMNLYYEWYL